MVSFLSNETLTIKRKTGGSYVNGNWNDGVESTFEIMGSVQPLNGEELQRLPENLRTKRTVKIYTKTEVENNDTVVIDSTDFQIYVVEDWTRHSFLAHYKIIAIRNNYEGQDLNG